MAVDILTETPLQDIITAIEGILADLGYELEDFSNIDIETWTGEPVVFLGYDGEAFDDQNGRQKNESISSFTVQAKFRDTTPILSRQTATLLIANLHHNITPEEINDSEKLVIEIFNQVSETESYEADITTLNYSFDLRYRNDGI